MLSVGPMLYMGGVYKLVQLNTTSGKVTTLNSKECINAMVQEGEFLVLAEDVGWIEVVRLQRLGVVYTVYI